MDIARGEFKSAARKLSADGDAYPESYTLHLLHARASRGLARYDAAVTHLKACCRIAPSNQVAWQELVEVTVLQSQNPAREVEAPLFDPVVDELEQLSIALAGFTPPRAVECSDPTPIAEQQRPFSDDAAIEVPTESLAGIFVAQGAYKKAIRVFTSLIQLKPDKADAYRREIDILLEKL